MDIEKITILSIRPVPIDVTSCHDAFTINEYHKSEVECLVEIRNGDVSPLRITTELSGIPNAKEAAEQIETILFELS